MNLEDTRKVEQTIKAQINTLIKNSKDKGKKGKGKSKPGLNTGGGKGTVLHIRYILVYKLYRRVLSV